MCYVKARWNLTYLESRDKVLDTKALLQSEDFLYFFYIVIYLLNSDMEGII